LLTRREYVLPSGHMCHRSLARPIIARAALRCRCLRGGGLPTPSPKGAPAGSPTALAIDAPGRSVTSADGVLAAGAIAALRLRRLGDRT
jgi:hypothetical protein